MFLLPASRLHSARTLSSSLLSCRNLFSTCECVASATHTHTRSFTISLFYLDRKKWKIALNNFSRIYKDHDRRPVTSFLWSPQQPLKNRVLLHIRLFKQTQVLIYAHFDSAHYRSFSHNHTLTLFLEIGGKWYEFVMRTSSSLEIFLGYSCQNEPPVWQKCH